MLSRRVIPCLDTRDGRVVKGVRFEGIRDAGDPVRLATRYQREGADEIVMLDITATIEGRPATRRLVAALRAVLAIPLTVGGGIRNEAEAAALLEDGADKVAVNSAALATPGLIDRLATRFGSQCVTLAIDAARHDGDWQVRRRGGRDATPRGAVAWALEGTQRGAGEVLLTSIDRDGTREGYDLELLRAVTGVVTVPVIASGGARVAEDLVAAIAAGADAVLAASIFHDGDTSVGDVKDQLARHGLEIRR